MNRTAFFFAVILCAAGLHGQGEPAPSPAAASGDAVRRFEIGGQATDLHLNLGCGGCPAPQFALGASAAVNINQFFAVEARVNVTPRGPATTSNFYGGHGTELLAGPRGFVRGRKWGLFAEAEPGLVSWSNAATWIVFSPPASIATYQSGRHTFFALNLGGGVEYSPLPRLHLRMDLADTLVRYNNNQLSTFEGVTYPSCPGPCTFWRNSPQPTAGAYWDVGKPLRWTPPDLHQPPSHGFFDKTNLALITLSVLGQASDAVTTQRFLAHGGLENDPLYKPFVDQGWPGQITVGLIDTGAQLSIMYALHRMHHHRIERVVPIFRGAMGGIQAYRNDRKE